MLYVDLSEAAELELPGLLSARRPALLRLRRGDYLPDRRGSLRGAVLDIVRERVGIQYNGPVRMLAHPRTLGIVFNPAAFYYVFDDRDERVVAVVIEVHNTPWNERHLYVLHPSLNAVNPMPSVEDAREFRVAKEFHVSPFLEMNYNYRMILNKPAESLTVHMENIRRENGAKDFQATLQLNRQPLTQRTLLINMVRTPWVTLKVIVGIYWHALRLKLRGASYVPYPRREKDAGRSAG
jgi:DUF1365 family protein